MAKATVKAIALKLGNAIAMPVLPYTPNNASAQLPGTIGLTNDILAAILERISEQAILTGFKNVILMGDHGGGQPDVYRDVAKKLDDRYAPRGVHVYYCDEVYAKAQGDFNNWLESNGYPRSSHAGIPDTSEMLYPGGDKWVRKGLIKSALGDPPPPPGQRGRDQADPNSPPRVNIGEAPPADAADERGPDAVKSKDAVTKYLKDSLAYLHKAVATIDEKSLLEPIKSPFGQGAETRLGLVMGALAHSSNHYGQMVEYLRMNGIIPPASQ